MCAGFELGLVQSGLRHPHYLSRLCQTWRGLRAPRSFLVLPEDLGAEPGSPCFLKVSKPKPGRRGMGRVQHSKIRDRNVSFLSRLLLRVSGSEHLYPGSRSAFRYRWNHLLKTLLVPSTASLTPGCLRAGGTVELYRQGMQIMDILWSLRLQRYLQEISTQVTMIDLPWESRSRILRNSSNTSFPWTTCETGEVHQRAT